MEAPGLVREAPEATPRSEGGFAGHLVAQVEFAHGANELITFDADFATAANVRRLKEPSNCYPFDERPLSLDCAAGITHRPCPTECRCRR